MRKHFVEISTSKIEAGSVIMAVQRSAVDHFEEMKRVHWEEITSGNGPKILRVSNPSNADYGGDFSEISSKCTSFIQPVPYLTFTVDWCPEIGVSELSRTTLDGLQDQQLRAVWAAAQIRMQR